MNRMTPMPPAPRRGMEEEEFVPLADAHLAAQGRFVTEANALADEVQANADLAVQKAAAGAASAAAAADSEAAASTSAAAAAAAIAAPPWVPNVEYAVGVVRWSPAAGRAFRRRVAGAGELDPAQDGANWGPVYAPWGLPLRVAANITLQLGRRHHIDTSAPRNLLMPAGPVHGDWLVTVDVSRRAWENNITLLGNGAPMPGGDPDYLMDLNGETIVWVFDELEGWVRG